jgi:hypothetical protein
MVAAAHGCPGLCGRQIPTAMFLCNPCADRTPDPLIVTIGTAMDSGDVLGAAYALNQASDLLIEG